MKAYHPLGYVTGQKWSIKQLDGKKAWFPAGYGKNNLGQLGIPVKLRAKAHKGGMIVKCIERSGRKKNGLFMTQSQFDGMVLNPEGEFVIPPPL